MRKPSTVGHNAGMTDTDILSESTTEYPARPTNPDFTASLRVGGATFTVTANRGTQARGPITGNPINDTHFGEVTLAVNDPSLVNRAIPFSYDDVATLVSILSAAKSVGDSRDLTKDVRP